MGHLHMANMTLNLLLLYASQFLQPLKDHIWIQLNLSYTVK
jgi:hypothetical protein